MHEARLVLQLEPGASHGAAAYVRNVPAVTAAEAGAQKVIATSTPPTRGSWLSSLSLSAGARAEKPARRDPPSDVAAELVQSLVMRHDHRTPTAPAGRGRRCR